MASRKSYISLRFSFYWDVCEHFSDRRIVQKRTHQNSTLNLKIVNDEIIFVLNEGAKAQHTLRVCEHFAIRSAVQKELIRTIFQSLRV